MEYTVFKLLIHERLFAVNNLNQHNGYDGEPTTNTNIKRNGM